MIAVGGPLAACARAAGSQLSILQDDPHLMTDPTGTLARLRLLGVQEVRVSVRWQLIAPRPSSRRRPPHFDESDPAAYPRGDWTTWDNIVTAASKDGIQVLFDVMGGAPLWATGPGAPHNKAIYQWEPSARDYGEFVHALATRYSGSYDPELKRLAPGNKDDLPAVAAWSLWNEPDYGPSLAPQGVPGNVTVDYAPRMYRALVDAGWAALHQTGHGHDTIMFGELAPRGEDRWGFFSGMKPLAFLRSLYCVDARYHPLRGLAAGERGCPTTPAGSRQFRAAHPALFEATAVSDHPYMRWYSPNREQQPDPDYSSLAEIGRLEGALDRLQGVYGSHRHFVIYDTEFGYITSPPKHLGAGAPPGERYPWVKQATAAYYLNWAEYLHWRNPRMMSFAQYLLYDPLPALPSNNFGSFASGLINWSPPNRSGIPKPTYTAWRMPLYLPRTTTAAGRTLEVWGCVRPATFAVGDSGQSQTASVQFARGSSSTFNPLATVTLTSKTNCYFDLRLKFPSTGTVRVAWQYPPGDPLLGNYSPGHSPTAYSRDVQVTVK